MAYRSTSGNSSTSTTSLAVTPPSGIVDNDILTACVIWRTTATLTPPTGFVQIGTDVTVSATDTARIYRKVAASESGNYNWGLSASQRILVNMEAFSGRDTTSPVNASSQNNGSSTSATATGVTPVDNCDLIAYFVIGGASTSFGTASGGSMTEREDRNNGSNLSGACDTETWSTGATGNRVSTISSNNWGAFLIALAPAPSTSLQPLLMCYP